MKRLINIVLILSGFVTLCGCDELASAISSARDATDPCTGDTAQVEGTWAIRGHGARTDCADKKLRTERFSLESEDLRIAQDGELLAFTPTGTSSDAGFKLRDAKVQGKCVQFRTVEGDGDDELVYVFEGRTVGPARIEGTFSASGPEDCSSRGVFDISIR